MVAQPGQQLGVRVFVIVDSRRASRVRVPTLVARHWEVSVGRHLWSVAEGTLVSSPGGTRGQIKLTMNVLYWTKPLG